MRPDTWSSIANVDNKKPIGERKDLCRTTAGYINAETDPIVEKVYSNDAVSSDFLKELTETEGAVPKKLCAEKAAQSDLKKISVDEKTFRWMLNDEAMATEKLAEGLRNFAKDTVKLEKLIEGML